MDLDRLLDTDRYLASLCDAYLAAPEYSADEEQLERALDAACERAGVASFDLLQRYVQRAREDAR